MYTRYHSHANKPLILPIYTHVDMYIHVDTHHVDLYIHVNIHKYECTYVTTATHTPQKYSLCIHTWICIYTSMYIGMNIHTLPHTDPLDSPNTYTHRFVHIR